jgi:hypothetical protein
MSAYDNDVGRDYAKLINATAREMNMLVRERARLIGLMEKTGWEIYESRREEGAIAQSNAPIVKSIRRSTRVTLEIE